MTQTNYQIFVTGLRSQDGRLPCRLAASFVMTLVALLSPPPVIAITEGADNGGNQIQLPRVTVIGAYSWGFGLNALSTSSTAVGISSFPNYRSAVAFDMWVDQQEQYQLSLADPLTTNDIRCSAVATTDTKQTTSQADGDSRFLAANQLFTAIAAQNAGRGAKAAIAGNPSSWDGRKMAPTFRVFYADGGQELWLVATLVPMTLVISGNVPNSLVKGNGQVQSCPVKKAS